MAVYRKVSISFWTDPKVDERFSPEDKYFFLYLLTNPHTNLCGCYEINLKQIKDETGYSRESISVLVDRFERAYNIIRYDATTYEMLILNWKKYNWSNSPSFVTSVQKEIQKVKNQDFKAFLLDERHCVDTVSDCVHTVPYTVTVTDTVNSYSSNSNNDINLENVNTEKEVKKKARKKYEDTPEFTEFWNAYPKQKDKTKAREEFSRVDVPLDVLLSALEIQKRSNDWTKEGGQYIPYPAKWLKGRRWEDSMEVNVQSGGRYDNLKRIAEELDDD